MTEQERDEITSIADGVYDRMCDGEHPQQVAEQALARLDDLLGTETPRAVRVW